MLTVHYPKRRTHQTRKRQINMHISNIEIKGWWRQRTLIKIYFLLFLLAGCATQDRMTSWGVANENSANLCRELLDNSLGSNDYILVTHELSRRSETCAEYASKAEKSNQADSGKAAAILSTWQSMQGSKRQSNDTLRCTTYRNGNEIETECDRGRMNQKYICTSSRNGNGIETECTPRH